MYKYISELTLKIKFPLVKAHIVFTSTYIMSMGVHYSSS